MSKLKPQHVHQWSLETPTSFWLHLMICPFRCKVHSCSGCPAIVTASLGHINTHASSRHRAPVKGRKNTPPSRLFPSAAADVTDLSAHRSMRVLFSMSDVCVFACSAAFESSAVYQRLNKRPLNINPCPHRLPAWGAYIYVLWWGQKIWLAGVKEERSTEKTEITDRILITLHLSVSYK